MVTEDKMVAHLCQGASMQTIIWLYNITDNIWKTKMIPDVWNKCQMF